MRALVLALALTATALLLGSCVGVRAGYCWDEEECAWLEISDPEK